MRFAAPFTLDTVPAASRHAAVGNALTETAQLTGNRHQSMIPGATTMQTEAHKMGREERRALLEQRRAAVARQLRRLAIELTDIDRQLDDIEQSER